jgi:hypothetical protein
MGFTIERGAYTLVFNCIFGHALGSPTDLGGVFLSEPAGGVR